MRVDTVPLVRNGQTRAQAKAQAKDEPSGWERSQIKPKPRIGLDHEQPGPALAVGHPHLARAVRKVQRDARQKVVFLGEPGVRRIPAIAVKEKAVNVEADKGKRSLTASGS